MNPLHYRERTVRTLPVNAKLVSLKLLDRDSGDDLLAAAGQESEIFTQLSRFLGNIRVERFHNQPFTDPLLVDDDRSIEWPYLISAEVSYPVPLDNGVSVIQLYLSERLGGSTQYLGDPETGLVGTLPYHLIEALDNLLARFPEDPGQPQIEAAEAPEPNP